jgi:hypothetical protein
VRPRALDLDPTEEGVAFAKSTPNADAAVSPRFRAVSTIVTNGAPAWTTAEVRGQNLTFSSCTRPRAPSRRERSVAESRDDRTLWRGAIFTVFLSSPIKAVACNFGREQAIQPNRQPTSRLRSLAPDTPNVSG